MSGKHSLDGDSRSVPAETKPGALRAAGFLIPELIREIPRLKGQYLLYFCKRICIFLGIFG